MSPKVSLEAIKALRKSIDRSIGECREALTRTEGDVEAAYSLLATPLEIAADRWSELYTPMDLTKQPPAPQRTATELVGSPYDAFARYLESVADSWVGAPEPEVLAKYTSRARADFGVDLPADYIRFLERWAGFDDHRMPSIFDPEEWDGIIDHPDCPEYAFAFGEWADVGYFLLDLRNESHGEVLFFNYSDWPPVTKLADSFEDFLRKWMTTGDLLDVISDGSPVD